MQARGRWQDAGWSVSDATGDCAAHGVQNVVEPNTNIWCPSCSSQGPPTFVLLGVDGSAPQRIRIAETIPHPDYRNNSAYNDVGLLRLEAAANMSDHVRPACLHRGPALEAGDVATATGWGAEELGKSCTRRNV